jgi:outer membrane protein
MKRHHLLLYILLVTLPGLLTAQTDSLLSSGTLENIIQYALKHQPAIQKAALDEQITKSQVNTRLADWYPQIGYNYSLQHNFQLQTAVFQGNIVRLGNENTSVSHFAYTQNILNPALVYTAISAKDVRSLAGQFVTGNKIDVAAEVSKAFYDVLLTQQQINVTNQAIVRLERSVKDAKNQYQSGIVDKTDYQRATILLNNSVALKTSGEEAYKAKLQYLKSLMGYPPNQTLELVYDSTAMEQNMSFDTPASPDFNNRIEYLQLQTQRKLNIAGVKYSKLAFLPSISGFAAYNLNYLNNNISDLYRTNYPNSYAGITLSLPLVAGGKRWMSIRQSKWELNKADWDITNLENNMNAQYAQAVAAYNSSIAGYKAQKENLALADDVYRVLQLQYRSGIKTYLEVLIAESDLRTAQINYYNSLFQVLSSKVDLQKALGQIKY